jgi:hypothetical protein
VDVTFASILGDRWETSGDGIYRLSDDREPEPIDEVEAHRARPESSERGELLPLRRWLRRALSER